MKYKLNVTYGFWLASVLVDDRVPDGVQVFGTTLGWDLLGVTTAVASWEFIIDFRSRVQRLMNITNEVDDQAESEGLLVFLVLKVISDLLVVGGRLVITGVHKEVGESSQGLNDVVIWLAPSGVVIKSVSLVKVGKVDEVPTRLEGIALALDSVSERGALGEWIVFLPAKVGVRNLE